MIDQAGAVTAKSYRGRKLYRLRNPRSKIPNLPGNGRSRRTLPRMIVTNDEAHSLSVTRRNNIEQTKLILKMTFISVANFIFGLYLIVYSHLARKRSVLTQAS
jgi:hypothetical protein